MRKMDEIVQMVIVGALTGAFIGGIVIGGGMDGALWGGLALAVGLALIVWPLQDRPSVLSRVKYGAAAFLPGMLVGGSQWVLLGAIGAVAGGMASSVLFAILFHNMIVRHEEQGRYVRTLFHYLWLFFGGSTVTFLALNAIGVAERSFPWQSWVRSAPLAVLMAIIIALALGGCVVCASWHKRRTETWRQAWAAARRGEQCCFWPLGLAWSSFRFSTSVFCLSIQLSGGSARLVRTPSAGGFRVLSAICSLPIAIGLCWARRWRSQGRCLY